VPDEQDLMLRAARKLRQAYGGDHLGADLALDKRLPMGGGLGGGSSDAATTLVVLNRLWQLGRTEDELAALALELGADVPLFVRGHSAFGRGRGEQLTPVSLPERWFVVVDPGVAVATGELFQAPDLTRNSPPTTIRRFFSGESTTNVFEPVVLARYPAVARAMDWLGSHAQARLTGTGGCVFAAFEAEAKAKDVATRCPSEFRSFVARGVDESPLLVALREYGTARI
jgi:4-diphosphocytidyl-2-C-methyl-D-erythritol kinase